MQQTDANLDTAPPDPFTSSNGLIEDGGAIRARMAQHGYLFFRGVLAQDAILAVRHEILQLCAESGWLKAGSAIDEGIAAGGVTWTEPQPEFMAVYNKIMRSEAFHNLALDPGLLTMFDRLFGEPTLAHPRNIARIIFPQNTLHTTPSHQDYIHVQGTEETYTAWIPLGDCPREMGSLAVLEGSHRLGILPVHRAPGAGGMGIDTANLSNRWVGGDFAIGDVIVFHSLAVHKALPNTSPDRIRLSVDYRYQPLSHPVSEGSLLPHHNQIGWPEIYAGWKSKRNQYYWRDLPLRRSERDPRVHAVRAAAG
jgi:hypothetical protein